MWAACVCCVPVVSPCHVCSPSVVSGVCVNCRRCVSMLLVMHRHDCPCIAVTRFFGQLLHETRTLCAFMTSDVLLWSNERLL